MNRSLSIVQGRSVQDFMPTVPGKGKMMEQDPVHLNKQITGLWARLIELEKKMASQGKGGKDDFYRSSIGAAWLSEHLLASAKSRVVALSLTPLCEVVVTSRAAIQHGYATVGAIEVAAQSVINGDSGKVIGAGSATASSLSTSQNLNGAAFSVSAGTAANGTVCFGWRVRLTASMNNWAFRPIQIDVGPALNTTGTISIPTPVVSMVVLARRLPVDILIYSVSNGNGIFSITPGEIGNVIAASATSTRNAIGVQSLGDSNTFVTFESLNVRDLMARGVMGTTAPDESYASMRDESYAGIRDEDLAFPVY